MLNDKKEVNMKMRFFIKMCVAAMAAYGASPALALTAADADKKLKDLEVEREADRQYIKNLKEEIDVLDTKVKQRKSTETLVPVEVLDQVGDLETKLKVVDTKAKKRIASVKQSITKDRDRFRINGFMSAGVLYGEDNYTYGTNEKEIKFTDDFNFRSDAHVALQLSYQVSDNVEVITQMSTPGYEEFKVRSEWAFLKYNFSDDLSFRVGRMRLPFYYYSESLDVGFSYPWVRPPIELYINEVTSYEGIDINYRYATGDWIHNIQIPLGSVQSPLFKVTGMKGLILTSQWDAWSFRLGYTGASIRVDIPDAQESVAALGGFTEDLLEVPKAAYYAFATVYDDGRALVIFEANELAVKQGGVAAFAGGYITFGWRFGKWTPNITYASRHTTEKNSKTPLDISPNDPLIQSLPSSIKDTPLPTLVATSDPMFGGLGEPEGIEDNNSLALGVRLEVTSNIAAKFEVTSYYGFQDTDDDGIYNNGILQGDNPTSDNEVVTIYSFVVDAVF